ncbi:MAG: S8 family serine peptidase, partial [Gammaproteobacteria bacterium]|nr:S8 family serine peptidase [Gammaproteobacteria bacterium]
CMAYGAPTRLPFADEGRAMLQIIHDVAPGAGLAFYSAENGEADFANGITTLAASGHANVIVDDVGYFDEPFFQDGVISQAVDAANAKGVAYFSAAGNNGQISYENKAPSFAKPGSGSNAGETLLTFGMNGSTAVTSLPVQSPTLSPGQFMGLIVQWDQPYVAGAPGSPGASSEIDLCVTGAPANSVVVNLDGSPMTCTGPNLQGTDSLQVLILGNPASNSNDTSATTIDLVIGLKSGSPQPNLIKVVVAADGLPVSITQFDTQSPTLQGHPGAAGAAAVGASFFAQTPACGVDAVAVLEPYSSAGGDPILFNTSGVRLAAPLYRQKPNFVGPDGVNTSFFGFFLKDSTFSDTSTVPQCLNDASFNNFFGTSAATPHAAAIAALMRQANPALTPTQIYDALQSTALPMGGSTPDYLSGYGFIQADAAMASLPAGAPVLKLSPSTISLGESSTLSWLAVNSSSCAASGSWNGSQSINGSQKLTPAATGTLTYTLTCTSAAGSQKSSANLTVQAAGASGGGGGGGGLDELSLLALTALACLRAAAPRGRGAAPQG